MKRIAVYLGTIIILSGIFTAGYYYSYLQVQNKQAGDKDEYSAPTEVPVADSKVHSDYYVWNKDIKTPNIIIGSMNDIAEAAVSDNEIVKPTTVFILETIDIAAGTELTETKRPTGDFIGLTREEIIEYLSAYMENMPLTEYEKGLFGYELVYFSTSEFRIKKTYDSNLIPNKFYLTLKNNYVIIYYSDMKTIYDYTTINGNSIGYADKLMLLQGFFVKDSDELFTILEGYTS